MVSETFPRLRMTSDSAYPTALGTSQFWKCFNSVGEKMLVLKEYS